MPACASRTSTSWTRRSGPRSDPATLPRRPARSGRARAAARAGGRRLGRFGELAGPRRPVERRGGGDPGARRGGPGRGRSPEALRARPRGAAALAAADPASASGPALDEAAAVAGARRVASPYRPRFGFVIGALIGIALAVVGGGILLATWRSGPNVPSGWSAWKPSADDRYAAARQIADHVGPRYRLGDGDQLVAVPAGPPPGGDVPLSRRHGPAGP